MKIRSLHILLPLAAGILSSACQDELSVIGQDILDGEVAITIDSTYFDIQGKSIPAPNTDARSTSTLLGTISTPDYGNLSCSFVTQLLPATAINIPDSIKSDDISEAKMILRVPRASITGDSLAPQQLTVFELTDQLPNDIQSDWDPAGKYNTSPLSRANYSLSTITLGDSAYKKLSEIPVTVTLDKNLAKRAVERYRTNPEIFQWPQTFAKSFPGLYVKSSFGKGCIANVSRVGLYAYWQRMETSSSTNNDSEVVTTTKTVTDSVCLMTSAPEIISSSLISYTPADKLRTLIDNQNIIITTPGGFHVSMVFPAKKILQEYFARETDLSVINNLKFCIPATKVDNSLGIGLPPKLLMVKSSEADIFFSEGKIPDNKTSFIADYSSDSGMYEFSSLRPYIVELSKNPDEISEEDTHFVLIPVSASDEKYSINGETFTATTSCVPYIAAPTMGILDTKNALIVFTFSNQLLH